MSKQQTCYFALTNGLAGCYMPDSHWGEFAVTRRKDLIATVRDILDMLDAPKNAFKQVKWRNVWHHARRYGTSSLHFSIEISDGYVLSFHGLTEEEYNAAQAERD